MKFKDYEYGWYGFNCSRNGHWMHSQQVHKARRNARDKKLYSTYESQFNSMMNQIPKLKGVIFIYGDYKTCI